MSCIHMTIKCEVDKKIVYLAYVDPRRFGKMHFFYIQRMERKKEIDGC